MKQPPWCSGQDTGLVTQGSWGRGPGEEEVVWRKFEAEIEIGEVKLADVR